MYGRDEARLARMTGQVPGSAAWEVGPREPRLPLEEVHVWRAGLDRDVSALRAYWQLLSEDERMRAQRFFSERDRRHFVIARASLRVILGRYAGMEAGSLRFQYNSYGKPALVALKGRPGLGFNVSHSDGLGLFAVTCGRAIGIDVERVRSVPDYQRVAEQFFAPGENVRLASCSTEDMRLRAFFSCWTRKEAYIKARGEGLSIPLDQFEVTVVPGEPALLLYDRSNAHGDLCWTLHELDPGPGYAGAMAVSGRGLRLKCWEFRA